MFSFCPGLMNKMKLIKTSDIRRYLREGDWFLCALFCLIPLLCSSQDIECPRFFKINIQNLSSVNTLSTPNAGSKSPFDRIPNVLIESKLNYPISWTGKTTILGEFSYGFEKVFGLYSPWENDDEELNLHRFSAGLLYKHQLAQGWELCGKTSLYSASNRFLRLTNRAIAWSQTTMVQRVDENSEIGLGLYVGHNNRTTILPVVRFKMQWRNGLLLDAILPSGITLSKDIAEDQRVYIQAKGKAGNYFLDDQPYLAFTGTNYRRISVHPVLGYEKMVSRWVGFSVQVGAAIPIRSGLFQLDGNWVQIHNFREKITPQAQIGFFLAFPN